MDLKASCTFCSTEYRIWERQSQGAFRDLLTLLCHFKDEETEAQRREGLSQGQLSWCPSQPFFPAALWTIQATPWGYGGDQSGSRNPTASSCLAELKRTSLQWHQNVLPGNYGLNSHDELWHTQKWLQKSSDSMTQEKPPPTPNSAPPKALAGVHS